jgi:hypothetical protein
MGKQLADEWNAKFLETSAKTNDVYISSIYFANRMNFQIQRGKCKIVGQFPILPLTHPNLFPNSLRKIFNLYFPR